MTDTPDIDPGLEPETAGKFGKGDRVKLSQAAFDAGLRERNREAAMQRRGTIIRFSRTHGNPVVHWDGHKAIDCCPIHPDYLDKCEGVNSMTYAALRARLSLELQARLMEGASVDELARDVLAFITKQTNKPTEAMSKAVRDFRWAGHDGDPEDFWQVMHAVSPLCRPEKA